MCGNKTALLKFCVVSAAIITLVTGSTGNSWAYQRALPAKDFRIGFDMQPGFAFLDFAGFNAPVGISLKFKEKFCLIPTFAMGEALDFSLGFRFEFPTELVTKTTQFEYDVERHEFTHHYYYNTWRPYFQLNAGTYCGAGGGVLGYISSTVAIGFGGELGYSFMANNGDGQFFFTLPKLCISVSF
jgi:hypothetical protein